MLKLIGAMVVTFMLAVPHYAEAGCAWLLWDTYSTKKIEHGITRAFETKQACEDAIPEAVRQHLRVWRRLYQTVNILPGDPALVRAEGMPDSPRKEAEGDTLLVRVSCWPLGLRPQSVTGGAEYQRSDPR